MSNLNTVLNERIARIARKEIKAQTGSTRKAAIRYRSDIAALKRQVQDLVKQLAVLEQRVPTQTAELPGELPDGVRYSPRTVKAQRARLGLSALEFGRLVGVGMKTIYEWEMGRSRPRPQAMAKLVALRGLGKREAVRRLEAACDNGRPSGQDVARKRGAYEQTALEFITSLVRSRRATNSSQINAAWKKSGRPGKADYVLSNMVSAGRLKRKQVKGERGGRYAVA